MSNTRRLKGPVPGGDIRQVFASMDGAHIAGGCDYCDAYQVPSIDGHGIFHITVNHDDRCPWLLQYNNREERS